MRESTHGAGGGASRQALHEVMAAFEAFKQANDARLAKMAANQADPILDEQVARIDANLQVAQANLQRAASAAPPGPGIPPVSHDVLHSAWTNYLRSGVVTGLEGQTGASGGGYYAPPQVERLLERRLARVSPMRALATVRTVGHNIYKKPVALAGETDEVDAPTLALLEFPAADLYANPAATQALLDDSYVDLDGWLVGECEDAFAAQETDAFVVGDGRNRQRGFLDYTTVHDSSHTWGQIGHVLSGSAGGFGTDPCDRLLDLIYAPKAQYRANGAFAMNRRTTAALRKLKDSDGNYIWQPATMPGQPATLFGFPAHELEPMPDLAPGSLSIAFGDFAKGYMIVDRAGVRVLRDPYSAKPYVLFYTTKRVGGGVQNFDAIKLMKFAAR